MIDYRIRIEDTSLFYLMIDYLKINADSFSITEDTDGEQGYKNYMNKYDEDPVILQNKAILRLKPFELSERKTNVWNEMISSEIRTQRFYKCSGPSTNALITLKSFDTFLDIPFDIAFYRNNEFVLYDIVHEELIYINYKFWTKFFKKNCKYIDCLTSISND